MPTRSRGASPISIDCVSLTPSGLRLPDKPNNGVTFLFGSWYQAFKRRRG